VTGSVLIVGPFSEQHRVRAEAAAPGWQLMFADRVAEVGDALAGVDVLAGPIDAEDFARAPRLRWLHSWLAGPNAVLFPELVASQVVLTSSAGNGAVPLAEHAMLLMLMLDRQVRRWLDAQRAHVWDRFRHGELAGATVGLFGLGNVGVDLARKAHAFHMRVIGLRQRKDLAVEGVEHIYGPEQLPAFVAECDFVVVTAPLTSDTAGVFDASAFAAMKPSCCFICVSRGGIVVDADLLAALRSGRIRGAGLDAHGTEPLPADSPFWDLPNVIITPHNGATTAATLDRQADIFVDNLARFVDGRPLLNVVDKRAGY